MSNSPAGCAASDWSADAVVEGNAVPAAPKGPLLRALGVAEGVTVEGRGMVGLLSAVL